MSIGRGIAIAGIWISVALIAAISDIAVTTWLIVVAAIIATFIVAKF